MGVTQFPTDEWMAQQLREATPWGQRPKYLIRDRDKKYATRFSAVVVSSDIQELKTPYRSPRANGICERFMGSLRRECLDHVLIQDGKQLQRVVQEYTAYSGLMLVDKKSSSVILEFLLKETKHAGGRSNDKRLQRFLYLDVRCGR
jgi:transposase InsO family protein